MVSAAHGVEVDLTPISTGDGTYAPLTVVGQTAWQNTGTSRYLYSRRPDSFAFTVGQTLYVRVTYFDDAEGLIDLQYDSQTNAFTTSPLHTRTSRVGSGLFVNGYFELPNVLFNKRQSGQTDFRIICGTVDGVKVPVQRITLSNTPFPDPDFQLAVARTWQTRYTGPAKDYTDATTLKGKVMTGYQGWFRTPNDLYDNGRWSHWARNNVMTAENFTVDMWPDLTEYDPGTVARAGSVTTASGGPAYLFSSASYAAVQKHFRWMRKHNIDGAWLQRFNPDAGTKPEWVLHNVSRAAAGEGRVWGVEYDVSSLDDATVAAKLQADWEWLTTQFDIRNDPRYIHEGGKPVVFIWGLSVPDRGFSTASANAVVDYFQAQGCHVLGGIPNVWNTLSAAWQTHIAKYDGVLVWQNSNTSDASFFRNRGQDFYPHIWPGFSWAHLKQQPANPPTQYTDRNGGQFYWTKGHDWINAGGGDDRLFIGMFDEYDESTAIMPMTDDPPDPWTAYGRFINNQGKPSDWWMMLTDELKRMMLKQRTNTSTLPTVASLANRSNIGPEASIDLGAADINNSLTRMENGDGNTIVETVGDKECRGNASPTTTHRYMYFRVNDSFAFQLTQGDVTIEVEYFDSFYGSGAGTVLGLQYDGPTAFTSHPQNITTTDSGTWRTVRFEVSDAYFGSRQNGSSDFRLNFNSRKLNVNRVWVRLPEGKTYPFTWTNATAGPALNWSQNANWLGGIVGQSDPTSTVRFFPGQTMTGGTIPITNNLTGQVFNQLQLGGNGSSSADTTITLSGNALSLDGTAPAITLDATKAAFDLTYDIAAGVPLPGTIQVSGAGDASLRISGALSGSGGLNKTSAGPLTLSGASIFTGGVTLQAGALNLNAAGVVGASGPLGNGGTLTLNGGTLDNTSGSAKVLANVNPIVLGGDFQFGTASGTSANNLTLPGGVNLGGATRTLTTNGTGTLTLSGAISNGGLIKTGTGQLTLAGSNTFTDGVTILNGTVQSTSTTTTLGTGTVTMGGSGSNGATFITGQNNSNPFTINAPDSGTIIIGANGAGSGFTLSGPVTLNGNLTFQTFANTLGGSNSGAGISGGVTGTGNLLLNNLGASANVINLTTNPINHTGTIAVQGAGTGNTTISANIGANVTGIIQNSSTSNLILGGANTYGGNLTINAGLVRISNAPNPANANPGNDVSTVTIAATGATLDLTYTGTDKVAKLFIGATRMADGVYGRSGSESPVIGIPQITGNGTLTVGDPVFNSWINGTFANGVLPIDKRGPTDDFDNDGISNLLEFAIAGQDPTLPNASVGTFSGGMLSFTKRAGISGLTYIIQASTDLGVTDPWAEVTGGSYINNAGVISYVLPAGPSRMFVRLRVTSP